MTKKIIVNDIEIIVQKKKIKNMYLKVKSFGAQVCISAPIGIDEQEIYAFASDHLAWINKQIARSFYQSNKNDLKYITGEIHRLWQKEYPMEVSYGKKNKVEIVHDKLILSARRDSTIEQKEKIMQEYYRKELKEKLPDLFNKWENIIGVKANFVGIKKMRTRWGSCNIAQRRVWINLQLAKKPLYCLEYIVVHELVHFLERTHSSAFMGYMDRFLPDWRRIDLELNGQ